MGQSSNNPFKEGGQLMSEYSIDGKLPELSISFLTHKKTQKEYLLREQTFNDLREFTLTVQKMKERQKINNPHLTNLTRIEERSQDHLCSNFYKIYTLWEYPNKSLADQITERALQKKRFESKEIWSILACSIMGLSNLQEQEIKHECLTPKAILTDEEGNVKIVDPLAHALQPNIDLIYNNRNIKHIYLSPEQCESIETQKPIINKNPYRNDVFVLGMILLECGLLERQDQCFLNDCSEVNFDRIEANLKRFGDFYEEELRKMVELMLNRDIRNRPDWIDLIKHVNRNSKNNKDAASARVEIRNSQRHFITRVLASDPEAKRSGSQMQPIRAVPDAQKNSVFYKEPQQILQSGYIVPISTFTPQQSKLRSGTPLPFAIPQNNLTQTTSTYTKPQELSYKPAELQSYTQPNNPFTVTFSNPQQFQSSINQQNYFPSPALPQVSLPLSQALPGLPQKFKPNFTSSFNKDVFSTSMLNYPSQSLPRAQENKQSIASNITNIFEQKLPYAHENSSPIINEYIRPAQSVNYQISKIQSPPEQQFQNKGTFSTYPFDPKLTRTPELGDNSELELQATFVEEHFKMGSRYEGFKLNGMRHGKGKFYYQDGGSYDGEWRENKMEGYGILFYQSNLKAYEGNWVNDQFQGFGRLYNEHPATLNQYFDYKNFDEIDQFWAYYEGNFNEDLKDGKGTLKFSNGETFEGTFKDDMVEGEGIFYCHDGTRIHGIWHENQLEQILPS